MIKRGLLNFILLVSLISCRNEFEEINTKISHLENTRQFDIAIQVINQYIDENILSDSDIYSLKKRLLGFYLLLENENDSIQTGLDLYDISIELNDENLKWETVKILFGTINKFESAISDERLLEFVKQIHNSINNIDNLNDDQINISLNLSKLYEKNNDQLHSATILFSAYHKMIINSQEDFKIRIYILQRLSQLYEKNNQIKDSIEIEKILIKELGESEYNIDDNKLNILVSIYNIIQRKDYETANKYLEEYKELFTSIEDISTGLYYQIYGDLMFFEKNIETHMIYNKSIKILKQYYKEDDAIFNVIIKDSLFAKMNNEYNLIYENYELFNELFYKKYQDENNELLVKMEQIISIIEQNE